MNICLIGGSGFVGTRLIELLKSKHTVLNIDKKQSSFFPEITKIADMRDTEELARILKGQDLVILLAAEHRDDVSPTSLYYDVNVKGTESVLAAMDLNGIKSIIFTSSVAVYGLNKDNPNEDSPVDPFNHYGKSKWLAEDILRQWYKDGSDKKLLTIIRPTVIFGERNRGNVYNLLKQISSGRFLMVGKGRNKKSMAYVGNIVSFIEHRMKNEKSRYEVFNYIDKPDFDMNQLVAHVGIVLKKNIPSVHVPYFFGLMAGYGFDVLAKVTKKKLPVSSVRVRKFCATTQFASDKVLASGFKAPFSLAEGLENTLLFEFVKLPSEKDDVLFYSE